MGNDDLVELIRKEQFYMEHPSPQYDEVLEVTRVVDRIDFLPVEAIESVSVDPQVSILMYEAHSVFVDNTKTDDEKTKAFVDIMRYVDMLRRSTVFNIVKPKDLAYDNRALPIGYRQTCSQPSMVAFMAYLLELEEGLKVFELGYGCGYSAAATSHLIGESGYLVAAESQLSLAVLGRSNLEAHFNKLNLERKIKLIAGNGFKVIEDDAPFDRVYLTAGVDLKIFDPCRLAKHLNPNGGILLFPEIGGDLIKQRYVRGNLLSEERYGDGQIVFVPAIGQNIK